MSRSPALPAPTAAARPGHPSATPLRLAALALLLAASALLPTAQAQSHEVDEVLAALEARADAVVDLEFLLEGELIGEDGQTFQLEVEVLAIPGVPAAGLYILQPDAIADNQIVIDGEVVRNYTFLTNQVSLYDIDDPDAFGGLVEPGDEAGAPISLDLAELFANWDATVVGEEATERGPAVVLRFDNLEEDANIRYVMATILEETWDPWRLAFYRAGDELFADLYIRDLEVNQGLTRADVTYLPDDAEVLDRRSQ